MIFNKLVTAPRCWPGGVSLTLDEGHGGHMIYIADHVIAGRSGGDGSVSDRLRWVMTHVPELVDAAERRTLLQPGVPQFVVLAPKDLTPLAGG